MRPYYIIVHWHCAFSFQPEVYNCNMIYLYDLLVDNNLSVYEIMENESLFHDTTRQRSGVE